MFLLAVTTRSKCRTLGWWDKSMKMSAAQRSPKNFLWSGCPQNHFIKAFTQPKVMCELTIHYLKPLSWLWRLASLFQQIDKNCLWSVLLAPMEITNVQHSSVTISRSWLLSLQGFYSLSVCTLINNSFRPICTREVAQLCWKTRKGGDLPWRLFSQ